MRRRRESGIGIRFFALLAGFAALVVLLYVGGRWLEARNAVPELRGDYRKRFEYADTVRYDGTLYRHRDQTTILAIGIEEDSGAAGYRTDFLRLLVFDHERQEILQLQIDGGLLAAAGSEQDFDGDSEQYCRRITDEVSALLLGAPVDMYAAIDLNDVAALNDTVGGVEVTLTDDFSALDPAMEAGMTLTLEGSQADIYVQADGFGGREARAARCRNYLTRLIAKVAMMAQADQNAAASLLDAVHAHLISDAGSGRIINELWTARNYTRQPETELASTPETTGGATSGRKNEDFLCNTVLQLFFEEAAQDS